MQEHTCKMKAVFFPHSLNTEIFRISDLHQNQQDSICTQFIFSNTYKYKKKPLYQYFLCYLYLIL